ncbi:Chromatin structure remodeling complex protein sfh1 [Entophlyctis sp. JEL0112]|nr:Chromatin structure remodeling complex protein sfh1 [Entophlyctis sp. JEL0112]
MTSRQPQPQGPAHSSASPQAAPAAQHTAAHAALSAAAHAAAAGIKPLLPYQNTYATRLKEGASSLLLPPPGIVVVGKRKRVATSRSAADFPLHHLPRSSSNLASSAAAADMDHDSADDSDGALELDKDDPKDIDAEAADDRLRVLQRMQRGAVPPAARLAAAAAASNGKASSARRLRRTRHEYLLPYYRDQAANLAESLVPIRLDLEVDGMKLKDSFMWNLKERFLTPKKFAEIMCEDLDVPFSMYGGAIEESMKSQIAEHLNLMSAEVPFEDDTRVVINLDILFNQYHLIDRFEWDLASPLTPEEFALQLAQDLGLGSEFPPLVAHAIHEQLAKVKTVIAAVGAAGPAVSNVEDVDEANMILGMLKDSSRPLEVGFRVGQEFEVEEWGPIVEEMGREAVDKYIAEKEKERIRRQRSNRAGLNRRRSGGFLDINAPFMNPGILFDKEESWGTPEERQGWKCTHCLFVKNVEKMEAELNKALDTLMTQLHQNMEFLIRTSAMRPEDATNEAPLTSDNAYVKDRYRVAQESQKAQGASANIVSFPVCCPRSHVSQVFAAEKLLGLTTGLKQQLLLNDFATLDGTIGARAALLEDAMDADRRALTDAGDILKVARNKCTP